jgi:hypothetical protein
MRGKPHELNKSISGILGRTDDEVDQASFTLFEGPHFCGRLGNLSFRREGVAPLALRLRPDRGKGFGAECAIARGCESEEIVITKHGKPAGILVGFASEDDWFDYKLNHDPRFLMRIARARASLQAGKGARLEDLDVEMPTQSPNQAFLTGHCVFKGNTFLAAGPASERSRSPAKQRGSRGLLHPHLIPVRESAVGRADEDCAH